MTEPSGFRVSDDSERVHLHRQLEEARLEELAAISEAAALLRTHAALEEIEAAHRRCEMARRKKQGLLDRVAGAGGN